MTKAEVEMLPPGIYRLFWKSGGSSYAAVGVTRTSGRWMAPVNWVAPTSAQKHWRAVEHAALLAAVRLDPGGVVPI